MKTLFVFLTIILFFSVWSAEIRGKVVGVSDGDTITVLDDLDKGQFRIRLDKIDAPEKLQAFGKKAKNFLSALIYGKTISVRFRKIDNYGRILGIVYCEGTEINLKMVQSGFAWHYSYYDTSPAYITAERQARAEKKGLWIDSKPLNPYEFRQRSKKGRK